MPNSWGLRCKMFKNYGIGALPTMNGEVPKKNMMNDVIYYCHVHIFGELIDFSFF